MPDDARLAAAFERSQALPARRLSSPAPWRERIIQWHTQGFQGTTIHASPARAYGHTGSLSFLYLFVSQLAVASPTKVPLRLSFTPGETAQVDEFGAGPLITHAVTGETCKIWIFVMTLCWSRHQYTEFVHDQQSTATWLACHHRDFERFGWVPGRIIVDNAKCAIINACVHDQEVWVP